MNITVVGGGNVGTLIAGQLTLKNYKVTIYTRDKSKWKHEITILDNDNNMEYKYTPFNITENIEESVKSADIIIITLPSFAIKDFIDKSLGYIKEGTWIGFYPGTGGVEFISDPLLKKGCTVFGTQRICSVVRLKKYGEYVITTGKRKEMYIGVIPHSMGEIVREKFSEMFEIDTKLLPNYLNVTLTPSNPILHPSRLYSIFKDYTDGKVYERIPLFYEEWTDETSKVLIDCDNELHKILNKIDIDTSYIRPLLEHYESVDASSLTKKIRSIAGFKGISTPSINIGGGYIPDFSSRYFTSDFPYGLVVIKSFALIYDVLTPNIDKILDWYQKTVKKEYINIAKSILGKDAKDLNLPQFYGILTPGNINSYYIKGEIYETSK